LAKSDEVVKLDLHDARVSASDREWLVNVYPLYLHDLSEFDNHYYELNDSGLWEPDYLPNWLADDTDHPLIICESGNRVGFALVNETPSPHMMPGIHFRVSEFFVLKMYRRKGFGRHAALALFTQFNGRWQLSVLVRNTPAIQFWRSIIAEHTRGDFQEEKDTMEIVYVFDAGRVGSR
jgi:predicted acetyltransferase